MALSPDQRRRLLRMNMLMSYAALSGSKTADPSPPPSADTEILTRDGSTILTRDGSTVIARAS